MLDTDKPLPASHSVSLRDWSKARRAVEFSGRNFALVAELPAEWFERCKPAADPSESIVGLEGAVQARIESLASLAPSSGREPAADRTGFIVEANARIRLNCQSCGEPYLHQVTNTATLWVARDAAELDRWEQATAWTEAAAAERSVVEVLLAEESVSALQLVEDELLLNLPYVPRCPVCAASDTLRRIELF